MPKNPTSSLDPTKLASELRIRRLRTYSPLDKVTHFARTKRQTPYTPTNPRSVNIRRIQAPAFEVRPRFIPVKTEPIPDTFRSAQRFETEKRRIVYATLLQDTIKQLQRDNQSAPGEMASDQAYEDFLNKASGGGGGSGDVSTKESKSYKTKSVNAKVPKALEAVEEYYTSDADEPFEVVSLGYGGSDISADELKSLIGHDADVSSVGNKEFDPQGQYKKVIDAVGKAGNGTAKVFKVEHGATRAEYYVVSVDEKEGRVVGLKALSVES